MTVMNKDHADMLAATRRQGSLIVASDKAKSTAADLIRLGLARVYRAPGHCKWFMIEPTLTLADREVVRQ